MVAIRDIAGRDNCPLKINKCLPYTHTQRRVSFERLRNTEIPITSFIDFSVSEDTSKNAFVPH